LVDAYEFTPKFSVYFLLYSDCKNRKPLAHGDIAGGDFQDPYSQIAHCLIYQHDGYYGFAEPYFIHQTLKDLVLHYRETSLFEHNDELDTTLRIPIGMVVDSLSPSSISSVFVEKVAILTITIIVQVKFSHTRCQALDPEQADSPLVTFKPPTQW